VILYIDISLLSPKKKKTKTMRRLNAKKKQQMPLIKKPK